MGPGKDAPFQKCIFVMALEPLLAMFRKSADIKGVRIGEKEYKVDAYADEVLLYISHP